MGSEAAATCQYCDVERRATNDVWLSRDTLWSAMGQPLLDEPGWTILMLRRHVEQLTELTPEELQSMGPVAARISDAITSVTDAAKVYVVIFLEANHHFHLLLTPRPDGAPREMRGPSLLVNRAQVRDAPTAVDLACRIRDRLALTTQGALFMTQLSPSVLPAEDFDAIAERVKNWGRWGPDDELGTLNFITPDKVVSAARLVHAGRVFELGVPLDRDGPQVNAPRRFNPVHMMTAIPDMDPRTGGAGIADDVLVLPLQASTQWDSLAHVTYKGVMYNGRPTSHVTTRGAEHNSIRAISARVITRGVLIDLARYAGVASLESGYAISVADLEGALAATGVRLGSGDALLIRTGYLQERRADGWRGYIADTPGLGLDTVEWIHTRELAAVATDTVAVEVKPSQNGFLVPFHILAIAHMGLLMGEIFDLEALAEDCQHDGVFEFLFVAPPLPVTGGVGSPINPYAVK